MLVIELLNSWRYDTDWDTTEFISFCFFGNGGWVGRECGRQQVINFLLICVTYKMFILESYYNNGHMKSKVCSEIFHLFS